MGERKRAAKLWEDTLVLCLRDAQWATTTDNDFRHYAKSVARRAAQLKDEGKVLGQADIAQISRKALPRFATPPGFIKLDGFAESATADVALASSSGLCFLIEVKSGRECARDEWKKRKKRKNPLKHGEVPSKAAFDAVKQMVSQFNAERNNLDLLASSFRCHQLAYWEVSEAVHGGTIGQIFMEPYINACSKARRPHEFRSKRPMTRPVGFEYRMETSSGPKKDPTRMSVDSMLRIEHQMSYRDIGAEEQSADQPQEVQPDFTNKSFGLPYLEFQKYINWLCSECTEGGGAQPINGVVMTTDGFFQVVSDTSELSWLLQLSSKPAPGQNASMRLSR